MGKRKTKEEEFELSLEKEDLEDDIYFEKSGEKRIENDEISSEEEGFMNGYREA